jgi:hypothetical protein
MAASKDQSGWLPTDPKQILLAVVLVAAVVGCIAWVMRYQASQPKPIPQEKYEAMYKAMYGGKTPAAPPTAPGGAR